MHEKDCCSYGLWFVWIMEEEKWSPYFLVGPTGFNQIIMALGNQGRI